MAKESKLRHYQETTGVAIICDSCGKESKQYNGWGDGCYDINNVTISRRVGSNYPEGGDAETFIVDLCPDCFEKKLKPWLEEQNIVGRTEESDW